MNLAYLLPNACSTCVWQLLSSPKKDWLNNICHIFLLLFLPPGIQLFSIVNCFIFQSLSDYSNGCWSGALSHQSRSLVPVWWLLCIHPQTWPGLKPLYCFYSSGLLRLEVVYSLFCFFHFSYWRVESNNVNNTSLTCGTCHYGSACPAAQSSRLPVCNQCGTKPLLAVWKKCIEDSKASSAPEMIGL